MIRVFVGYDPREAVAFSVLVHSINQRASRPVCVAPLALSQLKESMWRSRDPLQSTDFSFSRFLVPYLCNYQGWAIFMDCDMLVLDDIAALWDLRDERYAVQVVKHDHVPREEKKFLNAVQSKYQRKNWSSVMLLNCAKCRELTPEYVNTASGLDLHRFKWLASDDLIGELPGRWNHLVDYDQPRPLNEISNLHFTIGGPYFSQFRDCGYAGEWFKERDGMLTAAGS